MQYALSLPYRSVVRGTSGGGRLHGVWVAGYDVRASSFWGRSAGRLFRFMFLPTVIRSSSGACFADNNTMVLITNMSPLELMARLAYGHDVQTGVAEHLLHVSPFLPLLRSERAPDLVF